MESLKLFELSSIEEIKILHNVRLINKRDLNPVYTKENLSVQFQISGDLKGTINCYLCLDLFELTSEQKNYLFPLFVESMNILIGRQLSSDPHLRNYKITLSPPRVSMIAKEINTAYKGSLHKYQLDFEGMAYTILTEYNLEALN
jgi:hypothetical protein